MEMVDKLRDTAQSHDRCTIVEVMGRKAGHIALETGVACGATFIFVPEAPNIDIDINIIEKIKSIQKTGKHHFIIVVGEGYGKINELGKYIAFRTGLDTRTAVLGHVQRGGSPTVKDRVMASKMGYYAVDLLNQGVGNRVIAVQKNSLIDLDIEEALLMEKEFDYELYDIAQSISI
jgi:6-phosphofructokinase 1